MFFDFIGDLIRTPFICLGWVIVGVLAGMLARAIVRASPRNSCADLVLGLAGAFVGGLLTGLFGIYTPAGGLERVLASLVIATVGAIILILLGRIFYRRA